MNKMIVVNSIGKICCMKEKGQLLRNFKEFRLKMLKISKNVNNVTNEIIYNFILN